MSVNYGTHDWLKDWRKPDNQKLLDKMKKENKNARSESSDTFQ